MVYSVAFHSVQCSWNNAEIWENTQMLTVVFKAAEAQAQVSFQV